MIVVTIEDWPQGNPHHKRELGRIEIVNEEVDGAQSANFGVALKARESLSQHYSVIREGRVEDYPRDKYNPESNPYALLLFALRACLAPRRAGTPAG